MGRHERPLFVLFGASMTQFSYEPGGWGAAFQDLYQRKFVMGYRDPEYEDITRLQTAQADFLVRGYSGWNTRRALKVLEKFFPKDMPTQPALVVVFFGANDAAVPVPSGKGQAVPIEEFKDNLIKIASYLKGLSATTRVILVTPPPIHEEKRRNFLFNYLRPTFGERASLALKYPDRTNERAGQYASASKAAGAEAGVHAIDLWTAIQQADDNWGSYLTDGMHLAPDGSKVLLRELTDILKKTDQLPSLHWESMEADFEGPTEMDYIHPLQELSAENGSSSASTG